MARIRISRAEAEARLALRRLAYSHFNRLSDIKSKQSEYQRTRGDRRTPSQYESHTARLRANNKQNGGNLSRKQWSVLKGKPRGTTRKKSTRL